MNNRLLKRALPIVAALCLCHCNAPKGQKEIERYILESERQWAESVATGDTSAIERILADDFIGVDPKGALRGLGAMRLRGSHTLGEAIDITKGCLYTRDLRSRGAWNEGIAKARQTFQKLFYPQYEHSLWIRRLRGLPEIEEPISYQRLLLRRRNK